MRPVRLVSAAVRIAALVTAASASLAADIVLTPPAGGGVAITNAAGTVNQFRVVDSETTLIGNFTLDDTTATTGILRKAGSRFIHNFGVDNTFMGVGSGNLSMTGTSNSSFGKFTLRNNTTGYNNTALGAGALFANTTGFQNAAVGDGALNNNTTGNRNTATGANSMNANVSGNQNTAHGVDALRSNFGGSNNTAIGVSALDANFFGSQNTAVGALALNKNTSGLDNTATGWNALGSNTTGIRNTGLGQAAMFNNTTGRDNTAVGISSLAGNLTGQNNTAIGSTALQLNQTGIDNVGAGSLALEGNVTGNANTAVGKGALYIVGKTTAAGAFEPGASYTIQAAGTTDFIAIGAANNNPGTVFVATGVGSGTGTAAGNASSNIAIGANAGSALTTGSNNIAIGHSGVATVGGTTWIGQAQARAFIAGVRGAQTGFNNAVAVVIDSAGQLGTVSSSRRFKDGIEDLGATTNALMKLRPVSFYYKADAGPEGRRLQYGLIAEEVAEVYPQLVAYSADGQIETVMYQFLPAMLLNEYQVQQATIGAQAARIERLERDLAAVKQILGLR